MAVALGSAMLFTKGRCAIQGNAPFRDRALTTTAVRAILLTVFGILALFYLFESGSNPNQLLRDASESQYGLRRPWPLRAQTPRRSKIAKVSMLYGDENQFYERALKSHDRHNEIYGYPMHVLRKEILPGQNTGRYWNKPSYLLALVISELAKPEHERSEWLMWLDADIILINPFVPLEIFLPEADFPNIHFVGNKDQNGLNTGTFFLHVHEWTVRALTKAMALPMFFADLDLGYSVDQTAMAYIFNETGFRDGVLYMPRPWFNTYEWYHAFEGQKGDLLVHFPGLFDERWQHMYNWLETIDANPNEWAAKLEDTEYPAKITRYWKEVRKARRIKEQAEDKLANTPTWEARLKPPLERLKGVLWAETDNLDGVTEAAQAVQKAMGA